MSEDIEKEDGDVLKQTVREVKALRAELTEIVQRIHRVQGVVGEWTESLPCMRHAALAITHAEDARLRLGEVLGGLGDAFPDLCRDPYPTSRDPSVTTIDPRAAEVCPRPG